MYRGCVERRRGGHQDITLEGTKEKEYTRVERRSEGYQMYRFCGRKEQKIKGGRERASRDRITEGSGSLTVRYRSLRSISGPATIGR